MCLVFNETMISTINMISAVLLETFLCDVFSSSSSVFITPLSDKMFSFNCLNHPLKVTDFLLSHE